MSNLSPEVEAHDALIRQAENCHWMADVHRRRLGEVAVLLGCPSGEVVSAVKLLERQARDLDEWGEVLRRQAGSMRRGIDLDRRVTLHQDDEETILDLEDLLDDMDPYRATVVNREPLAAKARPLPPPVRQEAPGQPARPRWLRFVLWLFGRS